MRTFQFTKGNVQVVVKCDLIDPQAEHMTIMEIRGAKGTEFESIFPWNVGATLYRPELLAWFAKYSAAWTGKEYGGLSVVELNDASAIKTLTITPDITDATKATVRIHIKNSSGYEVGHQDVELTDEVDAEVDVVMGFTYSFEPISTGAAWTDAAPDAITVDGDETVTLAITVS